MITSTTSGVWELDEVYAKRNAERWRPNNNGLFTWGRNDGQLGHNDRASRSLPIQIPGTQWTKISGNLYTTFALKSDGTLWGIGQNLYGTLGQNNITYYSSPVQIPGTQWNIPRVGYTFALATKTDGTLWSWGYNAIYGTLGLNDKTHRSSPVQLPGTQWGSVSASYNISYASKTDGTLWAWGYNTWGALGQNDIIYRSSPIQVPGTQWSTTAFDGAGNAIYALKTDGTLWAWALNVAGQLGINDRNGRSSPVQVPGTSWNSVSAGYNSIFSTKTDGTLWSWGSNNYGQLSQNNTTAYSSPTQIPGTQWVNDTLHGPSAYHVLVRKTDSTLWTWGIGNFGSLANNVSGANPYSSPIQIPGTAWTNPAVGYYFSGAIRPSY